MSSVRSESAERAPLIAEAGEREASSGAIPWWSGVRNQLLSAVAAAGFSVAVLTASAIALLVQSVEEAARLEAGNLATAIAYGASHDMQALQSYVEGLDSLYRRDLFILAPDRRTIADVIRSELGQPYREDKGNEVGLTLRDGRARTFVETSLQHPEGAKQIVVPLRGGSDTASAIEGAVVLEYTDIANQLLNASAKQILAIGITGFMAILGVAGLGLRITHRLSRSIHRLREGVESFAAGQLGKRVQPTGHDEIGGLTRAFNRMASDLQRSQLDLRLETELAQEAARQVEFLAYTDKLTGLANRSQFSRLVSSAIAVAKHRLAVIYIDIDRFKLINDTLGHELGDSLLAEVGQRLRLCLHADEQAARLGGDEFVILLPDIKQTQSLSSLSRRLLSAIAQPIYLSGHELRVTASIGISVYPDDGADEPTLMRNADIAMYQAKDGGRNTYVFYSAALNHHSVERLAFEAELQRAFDSRQMEVHYQPKIDARSGQVKGVEALLRWTHPLLGFVSPARFIPIAEETGLIIPLGRWVLEQACRQQVAWSEQGLPALTMAVNLSARQFSAEGLLGDVREILEETGIPPASLELEITESTLMRDLEKALHLLQSFKQLGLRLAVDDFGTGYSSLASLKRFPIDTLKIDRAFVRDLGDSGEDRAIVQAIITMAKTLGLNVVAEGVEGLEQVNFLRDQRCDELQGYYFSKAVTAAAIVELLSDGPLAANAQAEHAPETGRLASS